MIRTLHSRSLLAIGVSAAALIGAAPALAQTAAPAPAPAQAAPANTTVGEIIVTAERRSESLQSTPVAVSAFNAQALKVQRLDGGQNLETSIPNVNYSRGNFGGYNFQIRGVGSKVVGEGGTSGVSFNVNELPVAANNFGDTDFYDVERVEVLRGPQGTLYGRNATGGAVNLITNKPTDDFNGSLTVEYGAYNERKVTGFLNLPLGDMFAVRIAGFGLARDGIGTNSVTGDKIDSRNLGDGRITLSFKPNDKFNAFLMYDHFGEDDSRNRVGKQLCTTDNGPASIGVGPGAVTPNGADEAFLSQGCKAGSLYSSQAYGVLNSNGTLAGVLANLMGLDTYKNLFAGHARQDSNLHDIESAIDPRYKADEDLFELHMAWNVTDNLTLQSITGFNRTTGSSTEDYNRVQATTSFNATPNPGALLLEQTYLQGLTAGGAPGGAAAVAAYLNAYATLFPNGSVNDPQLGSSNYVNSFDYGTTDTQEFTQELRLSSSFQGPLNFSGGVFFSDNKNVQSNYYVESSSLTAYAQLINALNGAEVIPVDTSSTATGSGHNYYDSRNSNDAKSTAAFGELYWNITPDVKLTVGARYTVDQLNDTLDPINLLTAGAAGFPVNTQASQTWREVTGRVNLDWTPTLSFTNKTLVYATYSRGYKGGGFNTPCQPGLGQATVNGACGYSLTYQPEFINAYEIGTKNVLGGGTIMLNADAFFYDYSNYQISEIVAESSVNQNINAHIYGVEFEGLWSPINHLTFNANVGYLHTQITGGSSVDSLNMNAGNSAYTLVKTEAGSNCLVDSSGLAVLLSQKNDALGGPLLTQLCNFTGASGSNRGVTAEANYNAFLVSALEGIGDSQQVAAATANALAGNPNIPHTPGLLFNYSNGCSIDGCAQNLKGNQLPNSPNWTVSFGAQYVWNLENDWKVTLHGDYYWQDQSYARVYNAANDLLKSWSNVNATLTFDKRDWGLSAQLWVKNAFNAQPITDTYVTDATSGLFTNTFTLDPRTYGVTLTKSF
jgi:outer membrane receptor protein involved in Fe transport